ncbi:uncharacterized protein LOC123412011 [Hordeum vulgare subsp. vulgare]|uniref:uncharacterized protein LOC123412011 n=1 Tax=Hordeum vulgare subsp. vulgare TaxID=112509 RepID=UPI001D1A3EAA|nr:uncharacterized protein LOC123412011 [Hordeum vulgare subsp. vulgare]
MEHDTPYHRGQNRWSKETWNLMVTQFHAKHKHVKFSKLEIQDKEKDLKREYMMLKEARKQSSVSWDDKRCMIEAHTDLWDNLMISYPSIEKFKNKSFPLFDSLGELYDGKFTNFCCFLLTLNSTYCLVACMHFAGHTTEGAYNFTSIAQPSQIDKDFEYEREVEEVKESDDLEMMNQVQHDEDYLQILDQMDAAHRKEDVNPSEQVGRIMDGSGKTPQKKPKKEKPKNSGDVIAGALEKYIELNKRQADDEAAYLSNEKAEATKLHDFSITKCMDVLRTMADVTYIEKIKTFNFFKDAANREIFINPADDDKDTVVVALEPYVPMRFSSTRGSKVG